MPSTNYEDALWAAIYDQYNQGRHQQELEFYTAEVRACSGPVVELACGTGMILLPLLEQGVDIHGFDLSQEMLTVLRDKAAEMGIPDIAARISRQDMRDFSYDLRLLMRLAGFTRWELYGNFDKSPFDADAGEMVWIVER